MTTETAPPAAQGEGSSEPPAPPADKGEVSTQTAEDASAAAAARKAFEAEKSKLKDKLSAAEKELRELRNKGKSAEELLAERQAEFEGVKTQLEQAAEQRQKLESYLNKALEPRINALPQELQESLGMVTDYDSRLTMLSKFEAVAKVARVPQQGGTVPTGHDPEIDAKKILESNNAGNLGPMKAAIAKYGNDRVMQALEAVTR